MGLKPIGVAEAIAPVASMVSTALWKFYIKFLVLKNNL